MIRYAAFSSYSHADTSVARWLHHTLETFRVPRKLVGTGTAVGPAPRRLAPIFRDRDELPASGDLGTELRAAFAASSFQIVMCSERAAKSKWVNEEILAFKRVHGEHRTLAIIIDGEPYSQTRDCFPPALRFKLGPDGTLSDTPAEPIAADIRRGGDGRRIASLKIIAGLTGLPLDALVQRDAARRQRRLVYIATGAVTVALMTVGLAIYAELQRSEAQRQRTEAVEQRQVAQREAAAARAAAAFLVGTFALANPARDNPRTITAVSILEQASSRARAELSSQPRIQVRLIDTVARAYNNLGLYGQARDALARAQPLFGRVGADAVAPELTRANALYRLGDLDGALATLAAAERLLAANGNGDRAHNLQLRANAERVRADVLSDRNDLKGALAAYDRALADTLAAPPATADAVARVLNNRGLLLTQMGRYDAAARDLSEANRRWVALFGPAHFLVGQSLDAIADNSFQRGARARPRRNRPGPGDFRARARSGQSGDRRRAH